ncbi:MAG: uracil-DNA glycosylase [Nitrososphaeraceae archaeon]|nr:uracil-DNA glycosylase [Nitrososphaeraceae archaeon]
MFFVNKHDKNIDSIEQIRSEVLSCTLCNLSLTRIKAVPGEGTPQSKIMFIGEAPGFVEDNMGIPFVGTAGKILDKYLKIAGINRSEVFITNIVKCRPPKNRVPSVEEQKTCFDYLSRQINIINPKIICLLGRVSFEAILSGSSILQNRGKIIERNNKKYFVTIHPAAIIYNKKLSDIFEKDLIFLGTLIRNI